MINEQEIRTGEKSTLDRNLSEDQIMELKDVQEIVRSHIFFFLFFLKKKVFS